MLLIESIRVHNRQFENLEYHSRRAERSRSALFDVAGHLDFANTLHVPTQLGHGTFKCRVTYDEKIRQVEFMPYSPKSIRTLQLVENDAIEYAHKFAVRIPLEKMRLESRADDVVLIKNGLLTDTTFSNIALWDGTYWRTPAIPLLQGTRRACLLDEGVLRPADIPPDDLKKFRCARLINAMLVFEETPVIPIGRVFQ